MDKRREKGEPNSAAYQNLTAMFLAVGETHNPAVVFSVAGEFTLPMVCREVGAAFVTVANSAHATARLQNRTKGRHGFSRDSGAETFRPMIFTLPRHQSLIYTKHTSYIVFSKWCGGGKRLYCFHGL